MENNNPLEDLLRQRLSLKEKDIELLKKENTILSDRLRLSLAVICETDHITSNTSIGSSNLPPLCAISNNNHLLVESVPHVESVAHVELVAYTEAGFILHNVIDGTTKLTVFEFTGGDFASAKYKIKKNELKFLGYQTIMVHFPTSSVSKEMKSQMKGALRAVKIVNWNTAFVDITPRLISAITDYRDNQTKNPYKDIANKLQIYVDSPEIIEKQVARPSKVTESKLVSPTQNDSVSEKVAYNKAPIAIQNMANLLMEMKSSKLKHVSPITVQKKRKTSLELHLASSLEKKFRLENDNDNELENNQW